MLAPFANAKPINGLPRRPYTYTIIFKDAVSQERFTGHLIAMLRAQGYCNAVSVISLPNPASIRAHESLGFPQGRRI